MEQNFKEYYFQMQSNITRASTFAIPSPSQSDSSYEHALAHKHHIIQIMEKPNAHHHQQYLHALILMGKLLKTNQIKLPSSSKGFLKNLREFFRDLKSFSIQTLPSLESLFLIILHLFWINKKAPPSQEQVIKRTLFTKAFRAKFLSLRICPEMNNEYFSKVMGPILLYLIKNFKNSEKIPLKDFIIQNISQVTEFKLQFYFFFSLCFFFKYISVEEIKQHNIPQFLINCLQLHNETQNIYHLYTAINLCLEKDKKLGILFLNAKILKHFSTSIYGCERVVLRIFQKLIFFIPYENIKQCFHHHVNYIKDEKIFPLSLRIMSAIIKTKQPEDFYLDILKEGWLKMLAQTEFDDMQTGKEVNSFLQLLETKIGGYNPVYLRHYEKEILQKDSWQDYYLN